MSQCVILLDTGNITEKRDRALASCVYEKKWGELESDRKRKTITIVLHVGVRASVHLENKSQPGNQRDPEMEGTELKDRSLPHSPIPAQFSLHKCFSQTLFGLTIRQN